jgi:hypothetical protein
MALDEKSLRKQSFTEGYQVTLADGQDWTFPRPRMRFRPKIADGRVEVTGSPTFGPEFDETLDILHGVKAVEPIEQLRAKFELAVRLLSANYDLTAEELSSLIELEPGDAASEERWDRLSRVILGIAPKPSPAI